MRSRQIQQGTSAVRKRRRFKQAETLKDRLATFAEAMRAKAVLLKPGAERDDLPRRASRADAALHRDEWANSPRLQPPE